jgi:hypothetical protein
MKSASGRDLRLTRHLSNADAGIWIDLGLCAGFKTLAAQFNSLSSENVWRLS